MQPAEILLTPAGGGLLGSDGVLEIDVPAGVVTSSDIAAAGGGLSLLARQVLPPSGGSAGGSGHFTFGTYLVQVLDSRRQLWSGSLHAALGMQIHAGGGASALDLTHTIVSLNQSLPPWFDGTPPATAPPTAAPPPTTPASGARQQTPPSGARPPTPAPRTTSQPALGNRSSVRGSLSSTGTTVSAPVMLSGSSTTVTWESAVPVASFGKPDPFEPGLSSGSLSAGYPLDLPAGPGGLTPQLVLGYSSASLNDQHNVQAAAPWVGEGWSMTMGSISWAEHNAAAPSTCSPSQTTCPAWDSQWELSDAYGTAAELIPPNMQVSTYNDDSTYPITPSPITWHTAPETHARVISFATPAEPAGMAQPTPPCFRVFLPSGIMEEFGCTPDSLQYYSKPNIPSPGAAIISNWLLDLITDPQGNQVHVTYQSDMATGANNVSYPRDTELATVEYDSPACHNAQAACTGSAWAPQMRVEFVASHSPNHVLGASCAPNGTLRCDDPADLSGSGSLGVPLLQNTFVLNDALVQVRASGSAGWNTLRDYQLSYEQTAPPAAITDPFSGLSESTAGKFDLTQFKTIGADGATALPPTVFTYTRQTAFYEDGTLRPTPATNCGYSWNVHTGGGCNAWSQSYDGNSFYLTTVSNGLGLGETFTWENARSNASLLWSQDPLYCDNPNNQNQPLCGAPDDGEWSRIALAQRSDTVQRVTQAGQGGSQTTTPVTGTTSYTYVLPYWTSTCAGCDVYYQGAVGMYWRSSLDRDQAEFYNDKFMGFGQTTVSRPDGGVEVHKFYGTEGEGVYDTNQVACTHGSGPPVSGHCGSVPWWDLSNAAHMHEYELDTYDTNGTSLLHQVKTTWQAVCPPSGVSGSPTKPGYGTQDGMLVSELDQGTNPVTVCDVQKAQIDDLTYNGATTGPAPDKRTTYTYDSYGRLTSQTDLNTTGIFDDSGVNNHALWAGGVVFGAPGLVRGDSDTAMTFDGSSGYVAGPPLGPPIAPMQGDNARSLELWLKTTSTGSQTIVDASNASVAGQAFQVGLTQNGGVGGNPNTNTPGVYLNLFSDDVYLPGQNLADGNSHHLVVTLSGSSVYVYVDGATPSGLVWNGSTWSGSVAQPFSLPTQPDTVLNPIWIGRARNTIWGTGSTYFNGTLDEVAVYNAALSAARVQAHLTAGSGYQAAVLADGPSAYYRLDDGRAGMNVGPNTIVNKPGYIQNDAITASSTGATGQYLIDYPAFGDVEDTSGNRYQCSFSQYDGMTWSSGQQPGLTLGDLSTATRFTGCGTPAHNYSDLTGGIATGYKYDAFGNKVATTDPDANAGSSSHLGCSVSGASYSTCTTYDGTFGVLPTSASNALNHSSSTAYQTPYQPPSTIADSSGHGNTATPSGSLSFGAPGLVPSNGDAATGFDGSTASVQVPSSVFGSYPTSGSTTAYTLTFEAWFRTTAGGVILGQTANALPPSTPSGWVPALYVDTSGALREALFWHGSQQSQNVAAGPYNDGRAHHVVATYSGGVDGLYVDGQLKASQSVSESGYNNGYAYMLGTGYVASWPNTPVRGGWWPFTGTIGQTAVYGTALSAARVLAHFSAGSGYQAAVAADSPTAYWRLNDGSPTTTPRAGYGLWPISQTDANGQTTYITYDALGREVGRALPGEQAAVGDSSGHGNQGTASGGITFGAPGLINGDSDASMSFGPGVGTIGLNLAGIDTTAGHQVTVEFWMKWNGTGTGMPFGFNTYDLRLLPGTGFGFNTANGDLYGVGMSAIPANTALHVVAVFTNGSETGNQLYINGVGQTLTQLSGTPQPQSVTAAASISSWASDNHYTFPGTLDEVAVYNGALSASRVQAHFTAGAGYKSSVLADSPLAYYRLNDPGYPATLATTYTIWCSGTTAQTPCIEVDKTQRLNGTTTTTSRAFYDGLGHLVETRSPAPGGQDIVRYSFFNPSQPQLFQSVPYPVSAYTGAPGAAAYSIPDSTVAGTTSTYDGLGRLLSSADALSFQTGKSYSVVCSPAGTGDSGCYEQTLSVDPNGHQGGSLVDGLGRTAYVQRYMGNSSSNYALYATAKYTYDFAGDLTKIVQPDGVTQTTFAYDMAGRKTGMTDPDLGTQTYTYDPNGNLTQSIDARQSAGTTFVGYDGLDRTIWRNTSNSPTGAYDTYAYDGTTSGNVGVGRMTSETFAAGALSGGYAYTYDGRGQQTANTLTVNGAGLPPPPAFVQQASGHAANVPSLGATFAANVTNGNRIVAVVGVWNNGATASGVTDSAGNTYTKVAGLVGSDGTEETIWTAPITAGAGTRPTVTATASGTADIGIAVSEYSGLSTAAGSAAVDQSAITSGTSSGAATVSSGATPATTAGDELAVGGYVDSGFGDTLSYGSGWTGRVNVSPASDMELATEDQAVGKGATPNAQVSTSASSSWLMATAVFKGASTGGANVVSTTRSSYDDAGNLLGLTYPDGQTVTDSYTAQGWLSGVATSQGSTTLVSSLAYGAGGSAFGEITGRHLGGGYDYSATYDLLDRAKDLQTKRTSDGAVMFDQSRTFDGAGNVMTTNTTMPGATDNQSFCYDEQDRLTWASSATATPPCGGSNTAGTLTAADYTQTFSYDVLGRLTSGPLGSYTYGSSAHVHAATGIGTSWTGAYDAGGNMTCRAPSGSSTCAGTQTGAQLGYNNEGELQSWQNVPTSTTVQYLYDGQGQRVEQSVTQSGTTTTTVYVGNVEEVSTTGGMTTTTAYYYAAGKRIGLSVSGVVSYLASDGLGSATVTLSSAGTATAAQLFAPYGAVRYGSGPMPTSYGFTGQRADAASGLDYYGARYYDPLAGQFTSGDTMVPGGGFDLWGLSRFAYVAGNPENRSDPTGHINLSFGDDGSAVPIVNAFQGSYSWGSAPVVSYHGGFTRRYPAARSVVHHWTVPAPASSQSHHVASKPPEPSPVERAATGALNLIAKPAYAPASETDEEALTARADQQESGAADPWIDAGVQVGLAVAGRGRGDDEALASPTKTQFGWTGSPSWRQAAKELDVPGTHVTAGGRIPTEDEAVRMIAHNGGTIERIQAGHDPGGVSPHTYDHINYYTSSGQKATVQIVRNPEVQTS
jgi:RHS repeat-associated protein